MTAQYNRPPYVAHGGPPKGDQGLPSEYLKSGYFDEKGNVLPAVIIDWPKKLAQQFDEQRMAVAQLRNFFAEVRRIEKQLEAGTPFASLKARILKLDAYAEYAVNKHTSPRLFKQFIEANLKWAAKDRKSFSEGFVNHFESVVAYFPKIK